MFFCVYDENVRACIACGVLLLKWALIFFIFWFVVSVPALSDLLGDSFICKDDEEFRFGSCFCFFGVDVVE